jgi:hypothetical protein
MKIRFGIKNRTSINVQLMNNKETLMDENINEIYFYILFK